MYGAVAENGERLPQGRGGGFGEADPENLAMLHSNPGRLLIVPDALEVYSIGWTVAMQPSPRQGRMKRAV